MFNNNYIDESVVDRSKGAGNRSEKTTSNYCKQQFI